MRLKFLPAATIVVLALAMISSIQNIVLGPNYFWSDGLPYTHFNNFMIFRHSFSHLVSGQDLYLSYPAEYADLYKYSPTFALLMAPFAFIPVPAALVIWNFLGGMLLVSGIALLPYPSRHKSVFVLLLLPELFLVMTNSQSNSHIVGLILLCFNALENGKQGLAAIFISLTVFIKIFTLCAFPLLIFYPRRFEMGVKLLGWFLILAMLPVLVTSYSSLAWQYQNWWRLLSEDYASYGLGLIGLVHVIAPGVPRNGIMMVGLLLLALPLLKFRQFASLEFRGLYLCLLLIWMLLFNHKAESPTFIIAAAGVYFCGVIFDFKGPALLFVLLFLLTSSLSATDLIPKSFRHEVIEPYCLRAIAPSLAMGWITYRLFAWPQAAVKSKEDTLIID